MEISSVNNLVSYKSLSLFIEMLVENDPAKNVGILTICIVFNFAPENVNLVVPSKPVT